MSMIGDYTSMREVDGQHLWNEDGSRKAPQSYTFVPGVDFDPSDPDEVAAVKLVGERDRTNKVEWLERENARLRGEVEDLTARLDEVER